MERPNPTAGLRHVALYVEHFSECENFYTNLIGMQVEWRPDADNVYLTSGNDNLALHRCPEGFSPAKDQRLGHIGFILNAPEDVLNWYEYLKTNQAKMRSTVKQHRDGAHSFYCEDPDGNIIQFIFHPPLAKNIA